MSSNWWWRGGKDSQRFDASPEQLVSESLQLELDFQLRQAQERVEARDRQDRAQQGVADYSWLATTPPLPPGYDLPHIERLQLEELCAKVQPNECGGVISAFREAMLREPEPHDVGTKLRAIIVQTVERRPKEETMATWVMKSVVKLRPNSRIMPIDDDEGGADGDGGGGGGAAHDNHTRYSAFSTCSNSRMATIDDLPV